MTPSSDRPAPNRRVALSVMDRLSVFAPGFARERHYFVENLALLTDSGLSVLPALQAIRTEVRSRGMARALESLVDEVENGLPLWRALEKIQLLPSRMIALVKLGEETGTLASNLNVAALQEEKDRLFSSKIHAAMVYPIIVLSATIALGLGMAWLVLPKIAVVASQLHLELPLITRLLVSLGNFLGLYGYVVVPLIILFLALVVYVLFFSPKTSYLGQEILFRVPGIRSLIQDVELGRFGYLMSAMLQIGISAPSALSAATEAAGFSDYRRLYHHLYVEVDEGNSFAKSFASYPRANALIPTPVQQMITTAERSGALITVFAKIGRAFEEKTDSTAKNLAAILEPVLLIVVWLGVLFAALSVILPIYSVIGGLNQQGVSPNGPIVTTVQPALAIPLAAPPAPDIVLILPGEQGTFLKVRALASSTSTVLAKVEAGGTYSIASTSDSWYAIALPDERVGWVDAKYVEARISGEEGR